MVNLLLELPLAPGGIAGLETVFLSGAGTALINRSVRSWQFHSVW
jgi:hypothetical protein